MSKIIPRYLLKKMFSPSFKFHSNISFNKSNLKKLLPFHWQMLVSWSQYLSASPKNLLKHYLSFYGIAIILKLRMLQYILKNSLIKFQLLTAILWKREDHIMLQSQRRTWMNKWHVFSVGPAKTCKSYMMKNTDLYLQWY